MRNTTCVIIIKQKPLNRCGKLLVSFNHILIFFILLHSHVIVLGDVNTSHRPIDHCDPDDVVSILIMFFHYICMPRPCKPNHIISMSFRITLRIILRESGSTGSYLDHRKTVTRMNLETSRRNLRRVADLLTPFVISTRSGLMPSRAGPQ